MGIRDKFAERFGEEQASKIEAAAAEHDNGIHANRGSDPFKWALLICIGYECMSRASFRAHHVIVPSWYELRAWIKEHADLATHDGDCDYLAAATGVYNEFMPSAPAPAEGGAK